jgi:hypothetical protein
MKGQWSEGAERSQKMDLSHRPSIGEFRRIDAGPSGVPSIVSKCPDTQKQAATTPLAIVRTSRRQGEAGRPSHKSPNSPASNSSASARLRHVIRYSDSGHPPNTSSGVRTDSRVSRMVAASSRGRSKVGRSEHSWRVNARVQTSISSRWNAPGGASALILVIDGVRSP